MIEVIENKINEVLLMNGLKEVKIMMSSRPDLCDLQCNDVFKIAKQMGVNPNTVGQKMVEVIKSIPSFNEYFNDVSFCAPGFINIVLSDFFINHQIKLMENDKFNISSPQKETYVVDYGGYNIAKPLHIGHLRPTIIGEAIKRILEYNGQEVIGDVHLGDYGLQIGQVIYGVLKDNKAIEDINIDYLNDIYPTISALCKENEDVLKACSKITKELQDGSPIYLPFWKKIYEVSLLDIKDTCAYLGTTFTTWEGESDAYKYLPAVEKILEDKKLLELSDGALVVDVKKEDDTKPMPPLMFKKSNGAYLYQSTDLATIYERKEKYGADHIIYVVDNRQSLHFEQVFRVSDKASILPYKALEHDGNGTVNGPDGRPFKTRKGDAPKLKDLFQNVKDTFISLKETNKDMSDDDLDKIVNAIIKYADLSNDREKDYIFDIEKFSSVVGKTGPYILYTYLRLNKILKEEGKSTILSDIIYNKADRDLRMQLISLSLNFNLAFKERKPHYIALYLYDLCVSANNFYQQNHIKGADDNMKNDWLYILELTNRIIKEMLSLLAIEIPSVM